MSDIVLQKKEDEWQAISGNDDDCLFCGTGKSQSEAIGDYIISNREGLDITIGVIDGVELKLSTVHGRPRTKESVSLVEKMALEISRLKYEIDHLEGERHGFFAKIELLEASNTRLSTGGEQ